MKYYIIPKVDIAMEINADIMNCNNKADAMTIFAINMDSDMNQYFKAVTEGEYKQLQEEKRYKAYKEQELEFRTEDAKAHMYDSIEYYIEDEDAAKVFLDSVPEEDYEYIAERFIDRYDCNGSENDLFDWLIEEYVSDRLTEMEYKE